MREANTGSNAPKLHAPKTVSSTTSTNGRPRPPHRCDGPFDRDHLVVADSGFQTDVLESRMQVTNLAK